MRLIDSITLELKEFFHDVPPYAILSHTWDYEELTLQEFCRVTTTSPDDHRHIIEKAGFVKIYEACGRARDEGLRYIWCDTVCIDKTSSAELSEAINSMYAWYRDSVVCYAYLADVRMVHLRSLRSDDVPFEESRWFTRGWTLQELLAPEKVVFFDKRWKLIGDRKDLADAISKSTRIHIGVLHDRNTVPEYSIAQRMSWAADRVTSRLEDIAYCLLGIFGINMSLIYGEGCKAFSRLQEEIIKVSDDQSIFAWALNEGNHRRWTTAFAPSPSEFRYCESIVRHRDMRRESYRHSNQGIALKLQLLRTHKLDVVFAGLNCVRELRRSGGGEAAGESTLIRRQFQIWISLRLIGNHRYIRDHHPASLIFLHQSYPIHRRLVIAEVFISIEEQDCAPHNLQAIHAPRLLSGLPLPSSGIFVTTASAKVILPGRIFQDSYPLKDLSLVSLKARAKSSISHQMVSCGRYSVFFSVLWDENINPLRWLYSYIVDSSREISSGMSMEEKWACLFGGDAHSDLAGCCSTIVGLYAIHDRLRNLRQAVANRPDYEMTPPLVLSHRQSLRNHLHQPEVVFECIFGESMESEHV